MKNVQTTKPPQTRQIRNPRKLAYVLNRDLKLGQELARGGEGTVYLINDKKWARYVVKIFHQPGAEKTAKIQAMLANRPRDRTWKPFNHISIAWPVASVLNQYGQCIGFIMPYIDHEKSFPLLRLYNPRDRQSTRTNFTWQYLLRIVLNLASIIEELHRKGYIIGDLNESNILVTSKALVTLVDCDSIQVPMQQPAGWLRFFGQERDYFRCMVAKSEYIPPELQGRDFTQLDRTANHDDFALAVLIFLMLMEGWHPFAAVWEGENMSPSLEENIRDGIFPYAGRWKRLRPKYALSLSILPPHIQYLMIKCFIHRHKPQYLSQFRHRPSAAAWLRALTRAERHLRSCRENPSHVYSSHLAACPWCARTALGIPDPFPRGEKSTRLLQPRTDTVKLRLLQSAFLALFLFLYIAEIYTARFYGDWFHHLAPQLQVLVVLILLILPVVVLMILLEVSQALVLD